MSSVFPVEQITKGSKLADWKPTGGNGSQQHRVEEEDEMDEGLGAEIIAALQKHGPCSPADLAKHCDVERPEISRAVHSLLEAKKVKAQGATLNRIIALPGQAFPEAAPASTKKAKPGPKPKKVAPPEPVSDASNAGTDGLSKYQRYRERKKVLEKSDIGIAINDAGELGLQRGNLKLALSPDEVGRLQRFLDCTKQFWAA